MPRAWRPQGFSPQLDVAGGQSSPVRSAKRSEPSDSILSACSLERLSFDIPFSVSGVTLVGLAIMKIVWEVDLGSAPRASQHAEGHLPHVSGSRAALAQPPVQKGARGPPEPQHGWRGQASGWHTASAPAAGGPGQGAVTPKTEGPARSFLPQSVRVRATCPVRVRSGGLFPVTCQRPSDTPPGAGACPPP